ncbi:MAG: cryptochrome/photolyase family protein, partial [Planctomycetota bacterium]|nr:cryptochrome/photolyase family protein [Planctomycetota bacterium]
SRTWVYAAYDQLTDAIGPLASRPADELGVVLVESRTKAGRRPYHRQKLALILANQRQFALEQARRGVAVRYVTGDAGYTELLEPVARELGGLATMEPAERELRADLAPLVDAGLLRYEPHEGFLTTADQFRRHRPKGPPWRMDAFYRLVRKESGILMDGDGGPLGGKFSFDAENRKPWRGDPPAAVPPRFQPDAITLEVCDLVEERFADHPGRVDRENLPATAGDAERLWDWALESCLPLFGPFEDAISTRSSNLFHTRISALLHLHRLLPERVVMDVAGRTSIPLASREGFIRQVLGWREFMRHVHRETDGFRAIPGRAAGAAAATNALGAREPLPEALWGKASGLHCLDHVIEDVWNEAYGHHITRLMVIANLGTLLGWDPRELTDWFWVAYVDAFDWVVEPNVLGMGTFALGELFTTKPYVSGAAYLSKMGDACRSCAFDPKSTCPITRLYWAFLARHEELFAGNVRLAMPLRNVARRKPAERAKDAATHAAVNDALRAGRTLTPDLLRASEVGL